MQSCGVQQAHREAAMPTMPGPVPNIVQHYRRVLAVQHRAQMLREHKQLAACLV